MISVLVSEFSIFFCCKALNFDSAILFVFRRKTISYACRNSKRDEIRKLEDDIVVTTIQILSSNMNPSKGVPTNKPSTVEPPKENKSTSQFGEYVPSIQQWEDKSRTTGTRPPTCNC